MDGNCIEIITQQKELLFLIPLSSTANKARFKEKPGFPVQKPGFKCLNGLLGPQSGRGAYHAERGREEKR